MRLHVIALGWVEYITLHYVVSACIGRLTCEIFAKIIFADSLQWPVYNYLLCNKKDSSHCNYLNLKTFISHLYTVSHVKAQPQSLRPFCYF